MASFLTLIPPFLLSVLIFSGVVVTRGDVLELGDADFDYLAAEHETMLVDCTASPDTCGRFGVTGYPTLKIFRNGEDSSSYDGPRSAGFFSGPDSDQLAEFLKAASVMREHFRFAHTIDMALGLKHGVDTERVLLFRPPRLSSKFEESVLHFTEKITTHTLRRFIRDNMVLKVGSQFASQELSFAVANRRDFVDELEQEFGLGASDGGDLPFVTIRTRQGFKYTMREEFTRDGKSLERFLEDYFAGRLKRYIKSEPIPEKNKGPVKVVVAESFEEIVNDPEKDVLIEFYAPWCGHCKSLEPKYKELAEQMDATANDVPQGFDVQGFPTIYFAQAGKKDQPKRYEGAREVKDIIKYLKREASHVPVVSGVREDL
ncbi:unnamed protein product [Coregonus sp. 'balchen']|nr:unnamed protein product [Coregonus sp. 'balchen']